MSKLISKAAYLAADVLDAIGRGFEVIADAVYDAAGAAEQVGETHDLDLQLFECGEWDEGDDDLDQCDQWDEGDDDLDEELLG